MKTTFSKETKRETINQILLSKPDAMVTEYKGNKIYTYTNPKGYPTMAVLPKNKSKLTNHFLYRNAEQFTNALTEYKATVDRAEQYKIERVAIGKQKAEELKAGDILIASWGWEQTNINFYLILSKINQTVEIIEIGKDKIYERDDYGTCTPNPDRKIGEVMRKRINMYGGVKINDCWNAYKHDGSAVYWSSYA